MIWSLDLVIRPNQVTQYTTSSEEIDKATISANCKLLPPSDLCSILNLQLTPELALLLPTPPVNTTTLPKFYLLSYTQKTQGKIHEIIFSYMNRAIITT